MAIQNSAIEEGSGLESIRRESGVKTALHMQGGGSLDCLIKEMGVTFPILEGGSLVNDRLPT